jgi:very-short-patch-repair endonuclease
MAKKKMSKGAMNIKLLLMSEKIKFEEEYRFHPIRKFRFDFAVITKGVKVAIEYEGVFGGAKSRHTSVIGYSADCEKYNLATTMGWKVLRYTSMNNTNVLKDLKAILDN